MRLFSQCDQPATNFGEPTTRGPTFAAHSIDPHGSIKTEFH
jgi:hypothetical protein